MGGDGRSFDRYPPHGRKPAKEEAGVQWGRIRAPPVGTPAHELHASDCLEALRPGDHFEIQWRKNKDFPYGTTVPVPGVPDRLHTRPATARDAHGRHHGSTRSTGSSTSNG